jgi:hypothetical protein
MNPIRHASVTVRILVPPVNAHPWVATSGSSPGRLRASDSAPGQSAKLVSPELRAAVRSAAVVIAKATKATFYRSHDGHDRLA